MPAPELLPYTDSCNRVIGVNILPFLHTTTALEHFAERVITLPAETHIEETVRNIVTAQQFPLAIDGLRNWLFVVRNLAGGTPTDIPLVSDLAESPDLLAVYRQLNEREVVACDPSSRKMSDYLNRHNQKVDYTLETFLVGSGILGSAALSYGLIKSRENVRKRPKSFSRRDFLKIAATGSAMAVTSSITGLGIYTYGSSIRQVATAKSLQICQPDENPAAKIDEEVITAINLRTRHIAEILNILDTSHGKQPTAFLGPEHLKPANLTQAARLDWLETLDKMLIKETTYLLQNYGQKDAVIYYAKALMSAIFSSIYNVRIDGTLLTLTPLKDAGGRTLRVNRQVAEYIFQAGPGLIGLLDSGTDSDNIRLIWDLSTEIFRVLFAGKN